MASNILQWLGAGKKSAIIVDALSEQTREGINKAYIPKFLYKPPFGYPRFTNMGYIRYLATTPYVEMCTKTIIDEIASIEWDIVPEDGMEDQADEAEIENIRNFFNNPNTNKETFEQVFIRMPVRDLLEVNSGVLNKVYNMKEQMVEVVARDGATFTKNPDIHGMYTRRDNIILPDTIVDEENVDPNLMNPWTEITATQARERAAYFQYGWISGPIPVPFGKDEIIWIESMKRTDDHYGYSPVQILQKNLQMLMYMIESDLDYYNENNVPKGIIGLDDSDSDELEAFKEQWFESQRKRDEFGNWKKMIHKVPITNKTPTFTRVEFSSSEMQVIEKQKWYTKMVWASFGVTPVELGYTDDAAGAANQIVQSKVFRKKAINPILRNLEASYNMNIVSEFEYWGEIKSKSGNPIKRPKYKFVFKTFDVDDEKAKYELYKLQTESAIRTINEVRSDEGLDEVEWGDEPPKSWQGGGTENFFGDMGDYERDYHDREDDAMDPDEGQEDIDQKSFQKKSKSSLKSKYKKRWRGRDGKWHYEYTDQDKKEKKLTKKEVMEMDPEDMTEEQMQQAQDMMEADQVKYSKRDLDSAKRFLKEKPHLRKKFGSDYYEFAVEVARAISRGEDPETIDWASIDSTINLHEAVMEQRKPMAMKGDPRILKEGEQPDGEKRLESAIKKQFDENKEQIFKILTRELGDSIVTQIKSDLTKGIESKGLIDIINKIKELLGIGTLGTITKEIMKNNYMKGWDQAERDLNINMIPDQNAIDFLSEYTFDNIKGINDDIADKLRGVMQRAIMDGTPLTKLKEEVTKVFDVGNHRIEMIARTEPNRAANQGRLQGYKKSGVTGKKVYSAHIDDRTSPVCKRLDGQERDLDDLFEDPKGEWQGLVPPAHPNCRSSWTFKIED